MSHKGYTLLELMIAMVVGLILVTGIAASYTSIKETVTTSQGLAASQEIIRYTNRVMMRSIKQTQSIPTVSATDIRIDQLAGVPACDGSVPSTDYTERYFLQGEYLVCDRGSGDVNLLKGVTGLAFTINGQLITVTIQGNRFPLQYSAGIQMNFYAGLGS
ncbi:prepilin-type N-terminal cleavage/methylation domain-containing protein [Pseudoalteromonas sp. PS5]|uniref:PilW family protein n=1 Tax=Pseudoalteromonas sp. PS5 TaxID=1437473 RepID=UPI000FFE8505|nr:prepilin-type N-terminal cleavage/methylation domain-containing protein [Pseudoalteromonas sp. PS5]RXF02449.1 prepilin-type N-terminal cleavage/methylation domain-containing protein [Pseudoalteromonas sp. PS5]